MLNTINALLSFGSSCLKNTSLTPEKDAQYLLSYLIKKELAYLYAWPSQVVDAQICEEFYNLIEKRKAHWPIAYLIGSKPFWSFNVKVNEFTLIPRPETEHLVESALTKLSQAGHYLVADMGTGSGAIGLAIAKDRPNCTVFATDINQSTLNVASDNASQLDIANIQFLQGDWYQALPSNQRYNLIVSNPPYVSRNEMGLLSPEVNFEPNIALFSEDDGLKDIRCIVEQSPDYLEEGGWLLVEHGFLQAEKIRMLFEKAGFKNIFTDQDYAGCDRITGGSKL